MNQTPTCLARSIIVLLSASLGCAAGTADDAYPATTTDGLQRVSSEKLDAVYVSPGASLAGYERVAILDCYVAFRKDWKRDQNRDRIGLHRIDSADMERIRTLLSAEFTRIFTRELAEKGRYPISEGTGRDVLLLRPALINLDVTAPDLREPTRGETFVASAGAMTLYLELYDSESNALIARAIDSQRSRDGGSIQMSSSVQNRAEADRMLRNWADILRDALDEAHTASSG